MYTDEELLFAIKAKPTSESQKSGSVQSTVKNGACKHGGNTEKKTGNLVDERKETLTVLRGDIYLPQIRGDFIVWVLFA